MIEMSILRILVEAHNQEFWRVPEVNRKSKEEYPNYDRFFPEIGENPNLVKNSFEQGMYPSLSSPLAARCSFS